MYIKISFLFLSNDLHDISFESVLPQLVVSELVDVACASDAYEHGYQRSGDGTPSDGLPNLVGRARRYHIFA